MISGSFSSFFVCIYLFNSSLTNFDSEDKLASTRYWKGGKVKRKELTSSCRLSEPFSPGPSPPREDCTSPYGSEWEWAAPRRQLLLQIWTGSGREPRKLRQLVLVRPKGRGWNIKTDVVVPQETKILWKQEGQSGKGTKWREGWLGQESPRNQVSTIWSTERQNLWIYQEGSPRRGNT